MAGAAKHPTHPGADCVCSRQHVPVAVEAASLLKGWREKKIDGRDSSMSFTMQQLRMGLPVDSVQLRDKWLNY